MLSTPLNIHWELTNRCNLSCVHCYQQDDVQDSALPEAEFLFSVAERVLEAGVFELTLTGGEILLVKQVYELIDFFNEAGIAPHVTSNGTLINDWHADQLAQRNLTFQVSIDSADPSVHDGVRGRKGALQRAVKGIARLVERRVPVSVAYTCMPQNIDDAAGVVSLAEQLGVDRVCIGEVLPHFGDATVRGQLEHATGELDSARIELNALQEEFSDRVDVKLAFQGLEQDLPKPSCTALERDLAILHDGHAYPCPFVRNPRYDLGSVLENSIKSLWRKQVAEEFRREKVENRVPHCRLAAASPLGGASDASAGAGCGMCVTGNPIESEVPES